MAPNGTTGKLAKDGWNTPQFLFNILASLMLLIGTAHVKVTFDLLNKYSEISSKVAVMEGNRFTSGDANEMYNRFLEAIDKVSDRIEQLSLNMARMPESIPPTWWVEQVNARFERDEKQMDKIEQYIESYEDKRK